MANTGHVWNHCVLRCWIFCELFIRGTSRSENAVQDVEMLAMISSPPSAEKGDSFQPKAQYSLTQMQFLFPWLSRCLCFLYVSIAHKNTEPCQVSGLWFLVSRSPSARPSPPRSGYVSVALTSVVLPGHILHGCFLLRVFWAFPYASQFPLYWFCR